MTMEQTELEGMYEVKAAAREYVSKSNNIDWEQRRYEIAKDYAIGLMLAQWFAGEAEEAIKCGVEFANKLIDELKK